MVGMSPSLVCHGHVMSLVCISPNFFCHGHYWLVYQLVLSVVDKNGWYINRFCLSWTILVGKSIGFVCRGQYWLVYLPVLSVVDNIASAECYNVLTPFCQVSRKLSSKFAALK